MSRYDGDASITASRPGYFYVHVEASNVRAEVVISAKRAREIHDQLGHMLGAAPARLSALEQVADAAREVVNDGTSRTALAHLAATVDALDAQGAE